MSKYIRLGMGLVYLFAFAVLIVHGLAGEAILPRETFGLAGLMAIAASRFFVAWGRKGEGK